MKFLDPKVEVGNIEIQFDANAEAQATTFTEFYGLYKPVIKILDELLDQEKILNFNYTVEMNSIPTFSLRIEDEDGRLQNKFTDNTLITGVAFLGTSKWYHKNNLFVNKVLRINNSVVLIGIFYNEKLYENNSETFKDKSLKEIFTQICETTGLGFVGEDSQVLNKQHKFVIAGSKKYIDLIPSYVQTFTYNGLWCIDEYYMLHIQNYDNLINKELDTYTTIYNQELEKPQPVIITNFIRKDIEENDTENLEKEKYKIYADDFKVENNLGSNYLNIPKSISLTEHSVNSYEDVGVGDEVANTFSRFKQQLTPFHTEILKKEMTGNRYEVSLDLPVLEIFPFMVVELELYYKVYDSKEYDTIRYEKNQIQSGKKIVIGYDFIYTQGSKKPIKQIVKLI